MIVYFNKHDDVFISQYMQWKIDKMNQAWQDEDANLAIVLRFPQNGITETKGI